MSDNYLLHKRILVVDDEQALLDMICSILQAYGFQNTTTAKSVREALMEAEKCPPELAILDVMLPDGNGFDLMTQLKKKGDYPVLFLTAREKMRTSFEVSVWEPMIIWSNRFCPKNCYFVSWPF